MELKDLIQAVEDGDPLSDLELRQAISHYDTMMNLTRAHGPSFHLFFVDCVRRLDTLKGYQKARESKR